MEVALFLSTTIILQDGEMDCLLLPRRPLQDISEGVLITTFIDLQYRRRLLLFGEDLVAALAGLFQDVEFWHRRRHLY